MWHRRNCHGAHLMKKLHAPRSIWKPRDFVVALNIISWIPDKFQWSPQMILATSKVEWEGLHLINKHVLEYALPIERPNSTIAGENAIAWSKKLCDTAETAMGLTWWRNFTAPRSVWKPRDFGVALNNINWRVPDKFQWSRSQHVTNDPYNVQQSSRWSSFSSSSRFRIPIVPGTRQNYPWRRNASI